VAGSPKEPPTESMSSACKACHTIDTFVTHCSAFHRSGWVYVGDAVKNGESARRLAVLSAWRDTELFTDKERAALTLAEAVTSISDVHARKREGASARKHLSAEEFSAASWLIITMNALNRVSIVSQHPVRRRDE
jgi:alkylhydroperoxidase family enzyme